MTGVLSAIFDSSSQELYSSKKTQQYNNLSALTSLTEGVEQSSDGSFSSAIGALLPPSQEEQDEEDDTNLASWQMMSDYSAQDSENPDVSKFSVLEEKIDTQEFSALESSTTPADYSVLNQLSDGLMMASRMAFASGLSMSPSAGGADASALGGMTVTPVL